MTRTKKYDTEPAIIVFRTMSRNNPHITTLVLATGLDFLKFVTDLNILGMSAQKYAAIAHNDIINPNLGYPLEISAPIVITMSISNIKFFLFNVKSPSKFTACFPYNVAQYVCVNLQRYKKRICSQTQEIFLILQPETNSNIF